MVMEITLLYNVNHNGNYIVMEIVKGIVLQITI